MPDLATTRPGTPMTLFALVGADPRPASLADAVLVIVDAQREYTTGRLPLHGVESAVDAIARLLEAARSADAPVVHVVHHAPPGSALFDPGTPAAAIIERLAPKLEEPVVVKRLPNAFTGTDLADRLSDIAARTGRRALLLVSIEIAFAPGRNSTTDGLPNGRRSRLPW